MTVLVIHCSRSQITPLLGVFAKLHFNKDNSKELVFPNWLKVMAKAAKVNDYRHTYQGGNRMVTHPY